MGNDRAFPSMLGVLCALCVLCVPPQSPAASKPNPDGTSRSPNVIIILVDDMGFSDIGCYGGEIETPHLDALAAGGLRFKQFYNTGRCCPTRASLMTGLHPHQAGIGHMTETPTKPSTLENEPYQGYLNDRCVTIAEALKPAGYATFMAGKWHLGYHRDECLPLQRGFDKYYGIIAGAAHYTQPEAPRGLTFMDNPVDPEGDDFYITDAFTDYAIRFITEHLETENVKLETGKTARPFFLYLAYNAPHWPLHAKTEDLAKYEGNYRDGWKPVMESRLQRQIELGLIDEKWTPAPHEGPEWDSLDAETQKLCDLRMAAYAACVDSVDQNVGRLVAALKEQGAYENTLLFFLTDNGACQEGGKIGRGSEAEIRDPNTTEGTAGPRCGQAWANASNTPFRKYKHFVHEGGKATPLVVHWPAGIAKKRSGTWVEPYAYLPDFMPTCLELAGADYPSKRGNVAVQPMQGVSLLPLLTGPGKNPSPIHTTPTFWEHEGNRAIRDGDWKLVWARKGPRELYNLAEDRTEMHDLAAEQPERAAELQKQWETWANANGVRYGSAAGKKKKN